MIITSIQYTFSKKDVDTVKALMRELREESRKESGVVQFEVGQSDEHPNVFALWEVYRDQAAVNAHAASKHFKRLVIDGVRPLAQQRIAVKGTLIQ